MFLHLTEWRQVTRGIVHKAPNIRNIILEVYNLVFTALLVVAQWDQRFTSQYIYWLSYPTLLLTLVI